jgi:hypothetical protein
MLETQKYQKTIQGNKIRIDFYNGDYYIGEIKG